jgi:predicted acetyltransferase
MTLMTSGLYNEPVGGISSFRAWHCGQRGLQHRRHGYATALVAALSAEGLGRGKEFCILYTDLMNATSNSIYQKIGYEPLSDWRNYRFRY